MSGGINLGFDNYLWVRLGNQLYRYIINYWRNLSAVKRLSTLIFPFCFPFHQEIDMNIILTSAVFTLVIFLAEGVPNVSNDRINSKLLILRFSHLELVVWKRGY